MVFPQGYMLSLLLLIFVTVRFHSLKICYCTSENPFCVKLNDFENAKAVLKAFSHLI